jgi:hypothetical protein
MTFDPRVHEDKGERPTTLLMRKNIMAILFKHYPHMSKWPGDLISTIDRSPWIIDIKDFNTGGVVTIRNLMLSGTMGVTIHLLNLQADPDYKCIVMNVGELLERYNIARGKALDIRETIYGMPRDWRGNAIAQT